jgi:hypothetical protein
MQVCPPLRFLLCLAAMCIAANQAFAESQPRQDRAWKHYVNKQNGYCVSYPSRWIRTSGFEGAGLSVTTGVTRYSMPIASLDISVIPDEPQTVEATPISLSDEYETHVVGLKRFVRAEQIETLEERQLAVSGLNGLFTRARYYDPKEKSDWVEAIVFTRRNGMTYRLELQSKAAAWHRFEPIFQKFVDSFQVECGSR